MQPSNDPLTAPYLYMVGLTTEPGLPENDIADFGTYYDTVHVPEVLAANPGFSRPARYALDGDVTDEVPGWLALYPVDSRETAEAYLERAAQPLSRQDFAPGPRAWESSTLTWRALWRRVSGTPSAGVVRNLLIAGIEPPAGMSEAELAEFNHFYDTGHVPEILQHGGYSGFARYELVAAPPGGKGLHPRYCTLYTADDDSADFDPKASLAQAGMSGKLSKGPEVWQRRANPWRAWWTPIR